MAFNNLIMALYDTFRIRTYERLTEVVFTQDQVTSWRPSNLFAPDVKVLGSAVCFQFDHPFEIESSQTLMSYPFQWLVSIAHDGTPPIFSLIFKRHRDFVKYRQIFN